MPIDRFWWRGLSSQVGGLSEMGAALDLVVQSFADDSHVLPPALILLTDGMPTDTIAPSFAEALERLDRHPIGRVTSRAGVAIGPDAELVALDAFVAATDGIVVTGQRADQLADMIGEAGSTVLRSSSEPIW